MAAKLDRISPEDALEQKVYLQLIRSIIERERRNAVKAADLLSPAIQYEATLDLFYQRAQAYLAARLYAKAPPTSTSSSPAGDGIGGKCMLHWRDSVSPGPMLCKATVITAARPTMISSPPGKARTRISRYSVKPKPNTRNSPRPLLLQLQRLGRSNSPRFSAIPAPRGNRRQSEVRFSSWKKLCKTSLFCEEPATLIEGHNQTSIPLNWEGCEVAAHGGAATNLNAL